MRKPFDKVHLAQLHTLCCILADTEVRHVSNIKSKYAEKALAFDETLLLLEDLNIVRNNYDELFLTKSFSLTNDSIDDFKKKFLPFLFSARGEISELLRNFLLNFQTDQNEIFFKSTEIQKIKFSDTRNLLLELEFITPNDNNTTYYVNPDYIDMFIEQFSKRKLSPENFKKKQIENDSIGLAAEKIVIEYEKKRLANILQNFNEIEHTSLYNVLAGYDIKSFENYLDNNLKLIDRYIEVKAVSIQDFKFYWSRNEIEIAKVFGEKYYLYLLPVISIDTFDLEKMITINNPFKNIYTNRFDWGTREECISFFKYFDE